MITRHNRDEKSERHRLQREQREIQPVQCLGNLFEIIAGGQRDILQKCEQIAARECAKDEINGQRKNSQRHANDAGHDEIMHGINAERFERFDFAERPRGAEFDDVRGADAREHEHGCEQRAEFTHDDNDHRRAEIIRRPDFRQRGNGLADDEKSQRKRDEEKHRQQRNAGAINFVTHARLHDAARETEFIKNDAERDECKRAQTLHG